MKKAIAASFALALLAACGQQNSSSVMEEIERSQKAAEEAATANLAASLKFLEENKAKPGVTVTKTGLQYQVVREGDAKLAPPAAADTVNVHYEGTLADGTVFDSSYQRGEPAEFEVGRVIPGWTEALQLMHPGGEYRLFIPPDIGYGEGGAGADIPGNAVLIFKVELLGYRTPEGKTVGKF